jgi:hypothetical protein
MVPNFEVSEQRIGKLIISAATFGVQPRSTSNLSRTFDTHVQVEFFYIEELEPSPSFIFGTLLLAFLLVASKFQVIWISREAISGSIDENSRYHELELKTRQERRCILDNIIL